MCCPALMESRGGSGAEGSSVQVQLLRKETELRSAVAVEETTKACMKSRALLLQYEEPSRNLHSLVFKGSQGRCSSQVPEKCAG